MSRNRNGFTIVEMLIVVLIIGILAGIALPKFASTRDKATLASIRSDVRNAETAEEAYFADNGYYATLAQLQTATNFSLSPGNTMTVNPSSALGPAGYTAKATNSSISAGATTCSVRVGAGAPVNVDSKITCP